MKITKEIKLHMAHVVSSQVDAKGNPGKCSQAIHGHTYFVKATVDDKVVDDNAPNGGMVIDFTDMKKAMVDVIYEPHDHACMLWEHDPGIEPYKAFANTPGRNPAKHHITPWMPTAENICKAWALALEEELRTKYQIKLYSLEVFETPTSSAIYVMGEDDAKIPLGQCGSGSCGCLA